MKMLIALSLVASLLLTGCGGGEETADTNTPPSISANSANTPVGRSTVIGPLTAVQDTISTSVMQPLAVASRGTALAGVVSCANFAIGGDALNIINAVAKGQQGLAQNPQAIVEMAPQIQIQILQLARDLQQMIVALAGGPACSDNATAMKLQGNPLAATPLAVLGDELLPVLNNILNTQHSDQQSLTDLANQVLAISNAYNTAYRQLPASVVGKKVPDGVPALSTRMIEVPVLGGVLSAFNSTLPALAVLIESAARGDTYWVLAMLENATSSTIENLLLNVLPLNNLQALSGSTVLSDPIHQAAVQIGTQLGSSIKTPISEPTLQATLGRAMTPVLSTLNQSADPSGATLLTSLLTRLTAALSTLPSSDVGADTVTALINTILPTVNNVLLAMLGTSDSATGTIVSANTGCQFDHTALTVLCSLS
ncbi:MAG: hypothetical protein V4607_03845 [Pseudomonadota bacterium]